MFGYHKAKRQKKRLLKATKELTHNQSRLEKENSAREKQLEIENQAAQKGHVNERAQEAKAHRLEARKEGRTYAEDVINREVPGLDPNKRSALQYEANRGINRSMQSANRKLLGDQSQKGIMGKGGVGYSQQRDLQKMAMDARGGVHRDLDKLNADIETKNRGAMFGIESGEANQAALDRQSALHELQMEEEKKRQRNLEKMLYKQFTRV